MSALTFQPEQVIYEDNHLLIINKKSGQLVQGDETGDEPLNEAIKKWIKLRDNKPGGVFCGVVHRLDRPVSGVVVFAKSEKALRRMNEKFATRDVQKIYWALTDSNPKQAAGHLVHWLKKDSRTRTTRAIPREAPGYAESILDYRVIQRSKEQLTLLEVRPQTGRPHQIRVQLSAIGCPIWGDVKYGAPEGKGHGMGLHARCIIFEHPTKKEPMQIEAPLPEASYWNAFRELPAI